MLSNLLLLQSGYSYVPYVSHEEIIEERKEEYYFSLRAAQRHHKTDTEDIGTWIVFFLDVLLKQAETAQDLLENDDPERMLSERQISVLRLFEDDTTLAPKDIFALLNERAPLPTIKQALARLAKLGLIRRIGLGRSTRYRKVE